MRPIEFMNLLKNLPKSEFDAEFYEYLERLEQYMSLQ